MIHALTCVVKKLPDGWVASLTWDRGADVNASISVARRIKRTHIKKMAIDNSF
ncbi:hypothetical protein IGS59_25585 [Janthinobacterium sp. GW460P]|uniref:hypothetical protein n=1 Tax=unclassified Janthinobacterium TaxID=2610881 RepID=UPI0014838EC1|nr:MULTISPECIES: hypothetical protein [unclassified Janthinobacterium]MCC7705618.1 hypothetical protein [Janthinobacterium sp. GW460P]MCC7711120.1 hypothetical protein [Janthinobacterium sp. GW460W]